jgi:hypothetical protein
MAKRQLGPGGPLFDYEGVAALDAPHGNISKIKVVTVTVDIASVAANTVLETSVALPAGTCSSRGVCMAMFPNAALIANVTVVPVRISAVDTLLIRTTNTTAAAIDPVSTAYEFWIIDP